MQRTLLNGVVHSRTSYQPWLYPLHAHHSQQHPSHTQREDLCAQAGGAGLPAALLAAARRHKSEAAVCAATEGLRALLEGVGGADARRRMATAGALACRMHAIKPAIEALVSRQPLTGVTLD